jgi:hypothetical protein
MKGNKHIPKQQCEYFKTNENQPALGLKWVGLWGSEAATFVFSIDADRVGRLSPAVTNFNVKAERFQKGSAVPGGLLISMIAGAVAASTTSTSDLVGLRVEYRNPKQAKCYFVLAADTAIIREILDSIPPEKITHEWEDKTLTNYDASIK